MLIVLSDKTPVHAIIIFADRLFPLDVSLEVSLQVDFLHLLLIFSVRCQITIILV